MKRVLATTCFAVAGAVALAAQAQYPQDQSKAQGTTAGQEKTVAVTGCLRAGDEPGTFVLANVKTDTAKGEKPTGTTGTGAIAADSKLRLTGAPADVNLKAHVGHTVQLTGTIGREGAKARAGDSAAAGAGSKPPATSKTPPAGGAQGEAGAAEMQTLTVKTMKHVAANCTM